jgi:FG-GAP-like repeat
VFFGNGDGTFRPQLTFDGIASMTADFNRDGKIDVLVILSTGQLAVCLGRGDGSFGNDLVLTPPFVADSFVAGDFNGDGLIDLAIAPVLNSAAADLAVFLGNGDGTFRAPIVARGALPGRIFAAADINGDGKLDLIAGNGVLAGLGDGRFHPPVFFGVGNTACIAGRGPGFPGFLCSPVYAAAVAADFSGDGQPDLAYAFTYEQLVSTETGEAFVSVLLNDSPGNGLLAPGVSSATWTEPVAINSLVTAFGTNLAAVAQAATTIPLPTTLGGIQVHVSYRGEPDADLLAPLLYVSPGQINYVLPGDYHVAAGTFAYIGIQKDGAPFLP